MPICADVGSVGFVVAAGDGLMERWRDMGPSLWLATAVMVCIWVAALLTIAALRDPRRVQAVPALLEPQGDETPAIVNLVTTDWDLGHEAIPGTLIDLAARRHLDIDMVGDDTFVTVRRSGPARPDDLTAYESLVLGHVSDLARRTEAGRVPAAALTTGPERSAKKWWKRFRAAVVHDSRRRGLSRPRWPVGLKTALVLAALPIAITAALAGSTLRDDPANDDDSPAESALLCGFWTFAVLGSVAWTRSGERDTPEGRASAARWLGLREQLAEDPLFAEQPPAAVAVWDRILAHGTALGVAHGVVQALPLGAESEREAWSPVGGRWRVVRVRYPAWLPPGYGLHPGLALLYGLLLLAVGVPLALMCAAAFEMVADGDGVHRLEGALAAARVVVTILVGLVAVWAGWMILAGLADLVSGRTTVEGRVLRVRNRYKDDKLVSRHIAVDDGTADKVRAWKFRKHAVGGRGDTVRGRVSRYLRHVADLEVVGRSGRTAVDRAANVAAYEEAIEVRRRAGIDTSTGGMSLAAAAMAAIDSLTAARQSPSPGQAPGGPSVPAAAGAAAAGPQGAAAPPPPLPDDAAVSAAAGFTLARDQGAKPHPSALAGGSALYRAGGDVHVQVAWVPTPTVEIYRRLPAAMRRELAGLGDEAYRARWGGGVVARRGDHAVVVTPHLPGLDDGRRDEIAARIAAAALAQVTPGVPVTP